MKQSYDELFKEATRCQRCTWSSGLFAIPGCKDCAEASRQYEKLLRARQLSLDIAACRLGLP